MEKKKPADCLKVCATCPWLYKNHGRKHSGKWYAVGNIRRLWNALRRGDAPGIVCHSSDADQKEYGGVAAIKPDTQKRACAGAILTVGKHIEEINACKSKADLKAYQARHKLPITKTGITAWLERSLFGQVPVVENRMQEVGLPWEPPAPTL